MASSKNKLTEEIIILHNNIITDKSIEELKIIIPY